MSSSTVSHDLEESPDLPVPDPVDDHKRSKYSYLFPKLADADDSGLFEGTDEAETIQRLLKFVDSCDPSFDAVQAPALLSRLPAAYTYFGQFVNHDISAPIGGLLRKLGEIPPTGIVGTVEPEGLGKSSRADVETILKHFGNEHGRPLNLASLYSDGPGSDDREVEALYEPDGLNFIFGKTVKMPPDFFFDKKHNPLAIVHAVDAPDIPREDRKPLIADQRNDNNLILSQMHLAFMLCHKKAVAACVDRNEPGDIFAKARRLVTLHYHWLILNDFLPAVLSRSVLAKPLADRRPELPLPGTVPMEFTTAAFRFGHSMVGRAYDFNANFGQGGTMENTGANLTDLFDFTSRGNMQDEGGPFRLLPAHWVIDWDRMTRERPETPGPNEVPNQAELIDLNFAPEMLNSAGDSSRVLAHGSILLRNLLRGFHRRIPFGQELARKYDVTVLLPEEVEAAIPKYSSSDPVNVSPAATARELGFLTHTPAWLYFLCESQWLESGLRVGPTASHIIADTFVNLMRSNPDSLLRQDGGTWHPSQSPLTNKAGQPLDSIRAFLLFATEHIATETG